MHLWLHAWLFWSHYNPCAKPSVTMSCHSYPQLAHNTLIIWTRFNHVLPENEYLSQCGPYSTTFGIMPCYGYPASLVYQNYLVMSTTYLALTISLNTLRPRQNGCHFPDDIFKCIFLNENVKISIKFHWSLLLMVHLTIFHHWFR